MAIRVWDLGYRLYRLFDLRASLRSDNSDNPDEVSWVLMRQKLLAVISKEQTTQQINFVRHVSM